MKDLYLYLSGRPHVFFYCEANPSCRSQEPKLGYIVLNRVGLEDYNQFFDAKDYYEKNDNLLICRISRPPEREPLN